MLAMRQWLAQRQADERSSSPRIGLVGHLPGAGNPGLLLCPFRQMLDDVSVPTEPGRRAETRPVSAWLGWHLSSDRRQFLSPILRSLVGFVRTQPNPMATPDEPKSSAVPQHEELSSNPPKKRKLKHPRTARACQFCRRCVGLQAFAAPSFVIVRTLDLFANVCPLDAR